jgi:HPt (histidine-containing phosphotransfer) domain-containing protein
MIKSVNMFNRGENMDEYIVAEEALKRVGGNMGLYKKLLGRFVEGNHYEEIAADLQNNDTEEAARKVHALKGVSANLSLEKLRADCVEIEALLKSGGDCTGALSDLKNSYEATLAKIAEFVG